MSRCKKEYCIRAQAPKTRLYKFAQKSKKLLITKVHKGAGRSCAKGHTHIDWFEPPGIEEVAVKCTRRAKVR